MCWAFLHCVFSQIQGGFKVASVASRQRNNRWNNQPSFQSFKLVGEQPTRLISNLCWAFLHCVFPQTVCQSGFKVAAVASRQLDVQCKTRWNKQTTLILDWRTCLHTESESQNKLRPTYTSLEKFCGHDGLYAFWVSPTFSVFPHYIGTHGPLEQIGIPSCCRWGRF